MTIKGIEIIFEPSKFPKPISDTPLATLVILIATSGLAVTRARRAAQQRRLAPFTAYFFILF